MSTTPAITMPPLVCGHCGRALDAPPARRGNGLRSRGKRLAYHLTRSPLCVDAATPAEIEAAIDQARRAAIARAVTMIAAYDATAREVTS